MYEKNFIEEDFLKKYEKMDFLKDLKYHFQILTLS